MTYGRCMECSCFTVDVQVTPMEDGQNIKLTKHRQQLPKCDWN